MTGYEGAPPDSLELNSTEFLDKPEELRHTLESLGSLTFLPYSSGLYPACELPAEEGRVTGMGMAWLRDNAHVADALYEADHTYESVRVSKAMLSVLNRNRHILDEANESTDTPNNITRLPVRVNGDTLANDTESRVQNDSTGYTLWHVGRMINRAALMPSAYDVDTLLKTVGYLDKVQFWQDPDEGHWEEDERVQASSIGAVLAGVKEIKQYMGSGYKGRLDFDRLLSLGADTLRTMLDKDVAALGGSNGYTSYRRFDAALLFLVEPLHVVEGERAEKIVQDIETRLVRETGVIRYPGDTYWEPRFPSIMAVDERTSKADGRTEWRNRTASGVEFSGTEAQWTLFDPLLSVYWGKKYLTTKDKDHQEKQLHYLDRSLAQLVSGVEGKKQIPEAFYFEYLEDESESFRWIPNDHVPFLWGQANLLRALNVFEDVQNQNHA
jgi:hypothetical protein